MFLLRSGDGDERFHVSKSCTICSDVNGPILVLGPSLGVCRLCIVAIASVPRNSIATTLAAVWGPDAGREPTAPFSFPSVQDPARVAKLRADVVQLRQLVAQSPGNVRTTLKLAEAAGLVGDRSTAVKAFRDAADIYVAQHMLLKALAVWKMLLAFDPDSSEIRVAVAKLYLNIGNLANARAEALMAIRLAGPAVPAAVVALFLPELSPEQARNLRHAVGR